MVLDRRKGKISLGLASVILGSIHLILSLVSIITLIFGIPSSISGTIGDADPMVAFFLILVSSLYARGAFLFYIGRTENLGNALVAWLSGLLILVVVVLVRLAKIFEGAISGTILAEDIIDISFITVLATGILSMILSAPFRMVLYGKGRNDTEEESRVC